MASDRPITIVLIDANSFIRAGCRGVLEQDPGLSVLADVAHPTELDSGLQPDLLIVDTVIDGLFDEGQRRQLWVGTEDAAVLLLSDACEERLTPS